jgi:hypothetical protein
MELVPRSIGELLTESLALLRRNAAPIALVAMPFCVLELVVRDSIFGLFPVLLHGVQPDTPLEDAARTLLVLTASISGLVLALAWITQGLSVAVTLRTRAAVFGDKPEPLAVLRDTLRRALPIAGTTLLWFVLITLFAFVVPGVVVVGAAFLTASTVVALLGSLLLMIWSVVIVVVLGLRWAVWPQVLALEGLAGPKALSRSRGLMGPEGVRFDQNPKFRLSVLMLVFFVVQSGVQQLFLLPSLIRGFSQSPPMSDVSLWSMPLLWALPLAFFQVATNALILPLNGVISTLFYYDLRVRYEGFDLDVDEGSAGGPT